MATAPEILIDQATRHQVFLERLKTGEANKYAAFLREIDDSIRSRLAGRDITAFTRNRLQKMLESVESDIKTINSGWLRTLRSDVREIAEYEADFEVRSLGKVIKAEFNIPTAGQLAEAVNTNPLSVRGIDQGKLIEPFMREWTAKTTTRVSGAISSGYYQGQTTNQILQTIRGTRAAGFTDGILSVVNREAQMMVRTAIQHVSAQAREATWAANSDIVKKVRWASVLDDRTTEICMSLDGQEYPLDKGPRPPIHIGCRSTTVPVLSDNLSFLTEGATRSARGPDGVTRVDAKQTYYSWLKDQPRSFVSETIGPNRAKLLLDGGISAERFAELQLGKNFKPITLVQMRELDPLVFERAGL
jgi:SPP1 gp7 family putative phage head morphogenesis protein